MAWRIPKTIQQVFLSCVRWLLDDSAWATISYCEVRILVSSIGPSGNHRVVIYGRKLISALVIPFFFPLSPNFSRKILLSIVSTSSPLLYPVLNFGWSGLYPQLKITHFRSSVTSFMANTSEPYSVFTLLKSLAINFA